MIDSDNNIVSVFFFLLLLWSPAHSIVKLARLLWKMSDESSTSSDSQEGAIRTAFVTVQALSRLRSLSGNFFAPTGFGRIRRESGPPSVPEASASPPSSSVLSTGSQSPVIGTSSTKYLRTVLILTNNCLYYEAQSWKREVLLEDLIGIVLSSKPPSNNLNACEMQVHYYPVIYNRSGSKQGRKQLVMSVQFDSELSLEDNVKVAKEWKLAILLESQRAVRGEFCFADEPALSSSGSEELVKRRLLVLVNPAGGQGRAVGEFEKHVRPLFDLAELEYEVIITERQNHGRELIKTYDFSTIDGIVIVSGDGLLYEVINGIMEREDWDEVIKTPVGMLPTGSGNALCASTLHESGEDFGLINAAFQVIRSGVIPLDLAIVQTKGGQKCYMSLLSAWGMIADIDIESEKYRKIGERRFFLGAISCIVRKRIYSGKISYLPFNEDDQLNQPSSEPTLAQTNNGVASPNDQEQPENASPGDVNGLTVNIPGSEAAVPTSGDGVAKEEASTDTDEVAMSASIVKGIKSAEKIMTKSLYGPKPDLLPPFSEPLPSNWKVVEKDFVTFTVLMIPHMASATFGDPNLSIGTKKMSIVFFNSTMPRKDMLSMLLNLDTGAHINMDDCTVVYAKAYRLEPETSSGILTVDGEVIPYGPMQAQIHPGLARVMCRKRRCQEVTQ